MLKEVLDVLFREIASSKLQNLSKSFYDRVLNYLQSLKIRANNEVGDLQRKIWLKEIMFIEENLKILRDLRLMKIVKSLFEGEKLSPEELPPEELYYYSKAKEIIESLTLQEKEEAYEEGKVLLLIKGRLGGDMSKKFGLPELEPEDVIFINKQVGKVLINLGLAEEIKLR